MVRGEPHAGQDTHLERVGVEAQPQSVSVVPGAQRVAHDPYVFEVREVRVLLKEQQGNIKAFKNATEHLARAGQAFLKLHSNR